MKYIVVFVTASSLSEAKKISDNLLSKKLAACVSIVPKVRSNFIWKGNMTEANEVLLIAKTKFSKFNELEKQVKKNHSYEVPEIIALPIVAGNKEYLKWIDDSV